MYIGEWGKKIVTVCHVLWYRTQEDSGLQINAEPMHYFATAAVPRSTEEVHSRILNPPDVGYLKDVAKKCLRYVFMRLLFSQGYRVCFNLHVVTIVRCSVSEDGQKMENHSAEVLLWVSQYVSWGVKGKASGSAVCNRLGSCRDCEDVTLLSMYSYVPWARFAVSVTHTA
jgi:hypothetical protein